MGYIIMIFVHTVLVGMDVKTLHLLLTRHFFKFSGIIYPLVNDHIAGWNFPMFNWKYIDSIRGPHVPDSYVRLPECNFGCWDLFFSKKITTHPDIAHPFGNPLGQLWNNLRVFSISPRQLAATVIPGLINDWIPGLIMGWNENKFPS